jgi:hypothetical protein
MQKAFGAVYLIFAIVSSVIRFNQSQSAEYRSCYNLCIYVSWTQRLSVSRIERESSVLSLLHIPLPLPLDTAVLVLSVGMFVLAVVLYDAYRQYGA